MNKIMKLFSAAIIPVIIVSFLLIKSLFLDKPRVNTVNMPVGLGKISVFLSPAAQILKFNEQVNVSVVLENKTAENFSLNTSGFDIQFDRNVFSVTNIACNPDFLGIMAKNEATDNKIFLTCMGGGGSMQEIISGDKKEIGSFTLSVKQFAPKGETKLSFSRVYIPNAGDESYADLGDRGKEAVYTINY